ncbi:hypothetical protein OIDMADRAFT_52618 [Oidiodendron maius Zn]|uniref:Transcription factor domain-containing protein n=1 Tax=Oidiodendron maius (strain Zn) TaxID=913774 RepID=A0A0C3DL89_OIDMZ|nr:hypothetical protein OIDMADRAFT_52618 [Oidiodendron maius Zn]
MALEGPSPFMEEESFLSPETLSSLDDYAVNPRFLELQEELRSVLFTGITSLAPSRNPSPEPSEPINSVPATRLKHSLDFSRVSISKKKLLGYLRNWITECAPYLDKFDEARHFGIQVPIIAQTSPALLYAVLAFSARQTERKAGLESRDSLELYQVSIRLLAPILQAKDPNVLVTVCILACLELMSVSPKNWRRHVEGCAALFDSFGVNGFSGGLLQAVFWCYARMDLCGVILANGAESPVLPIEKWVSIAAGDSSSKDNIEDGIKYSFLQKSTSTPDMHANWAVYLCAKVCDLVCRRTMSLERGQIDQSDERPFGEQWIRLWDELQFWMEHRPSMMLPIKTIGSNTEQRFPEIFFAHWAAISGNQLYHTACIMMLEIIPANQELQPLTPHFSAVWHARRVCGISITNPHSGSRINAIQPLYVAGKILSHRSEHIIIAKLVKSIEKTTGWGAIWRLKDLERAWGYEPGEILSAI